MGCNCQAVKFLAQWAGNIGGADESGNALICIGERLGSVAVDAGCDRFARIHFKGIEAMETIAAIQVGAAAVEDRHPHDPEHRW